MVGLMKIYGALLQIPGMETVELTWQEQISTNWENTGFMRWPLAACLLLGILVIIWKFFSLMSKSGATRKILRNVDELLAAQRIDEALEVTRESDSPGAKILYAGLERHEEGTERVMKAVIGMILAFQSIEAAGEVEATLVAGGIKVALLTTAFGLGIAIPMSIFHNYFVARIDGLVIDMEESAQKMIDALHAIERGRQAAAS